MTTRQPRNSTRESLAELARELGRADRAWAILAEGNVAAMADDTTMCVKASGTRMNTATASDMVQAARQDLLDLVDDPSADETIVAQVFDSVASRCRGRRPSVESLLHAVCLDRPGVRFVGHTHPSAVNALLCSPRADLLVEGSLFPDQIVVLGRRPMLLPYVDPGLELARLARRSLSERRDTPSVIYLRNHGMFALGPSADAVLDITEMSVKVAHIILGSIVAGGPTFMGSADSDRIETRPDELLRRAALAAGSRQ